ncbi:MAG: phenylalanyl-tRNA synthetase beta chain [Frankiales bacterium]|jgi:phenylalanyl-tRNA synthetase beta chain|nr:phenylalanyl-tRNA synthetase beta chain [Frankiales bacterium]
MRAPLSWLREYADLPAGESGRAVAERLVRVGLEVETVISPAEQIKGPLLVGDVVAFDEEEHGNGKTIRWCQVSVGEAEPRGIVCGARNFAVGDRVAVALPGAVLPGGFEISARKTYGHISDGMICSARELGIGDDHAGILVLRPDAPVGADALSELGLDDEILDIAVTPDRGYCLSMRGLAREVATAYSVAFHDPAAVDVPDAAGGYPLHIEDQVGCDRFVALSVHGVDPAKPTPDWLAQRIRAAGMRPISLIVDVTNYVMLELGQPLHAYDATRLTGTLGVRRARVGEKLETLDGTTRSVEPSDLVIVDGSGVIGLAGVMGGASTEISAATSDVLLEAAHFDPIAIAATARRHKLPSEASRRFERGVDPELGPYAAARAAALLADYGGATVGGRSDAAALRPRPTIEMDADLPTRIVGLQLTQEDVVGRLEAIGCAVSVEGRLSVTPPSWRPDLTAPYDLVEEVARLTGYDTVPSVLPSVPPGHGLTTRQRLRRRLGSALASLGYVETLCYPFMGTDVLDAFGLDDDDPRRRALRLANPISDEEPLLRTTLLPGLLAALKRNVGRGLTDVALFEGGLVFRPRPGAPAPPRLGVDRPPTADELTAITAGLPDQPERVAVVLAGGREPQGWWGEGRPALWADAVEAARTIAWTAGAQLDSRPDRHAPWHPGRCAELVVDGRTVGHAGELHPRVIAALELPERTCAMELDLDLMVPTPPPPVMAPRISTFPPALQDVALVVDRTVPAAEVEAALRDGAGEMLESIRLFDVYEGPQVGEAKKSLAYSLRFRALDRTLTAEEATGLRDAAIAEARRRTGAELRT